MYATNRDWGQPFLCSDSDRRIFRFNLNKGTAVSYTFLGIFHFQMSIGMSHVEKLLVVLNEILCNILIALILSLSISKLI